MKNDKDARHMEVKSKIDYLKKNKKNIGKNIFKFIVCVIMFWAVNSVCLFAGHNTLGFALVFAIITFGYNPIIIGFIFGATFYLHDLDASSLEISAIVIIVCVVLYLVNRWKKITYNKGLNYILFIVSIIPYIYINIGTMRSNAGMFLSMLFSVFFLYICVSFFKGTIRRGFNNRLNPDEKICGAILLTIIAFGLSSIDLFDVDIATIVTSILVLFIAYIYGILESTLVAFVMGLGVSLHLVNPIYISYYLLMGVVAGAFKSSTKIFSSLGVILINIFFTLYFTNYIVFEPITLIAVAVLVLAFAFVPRRFIAWLKDVFAGYKSNVAVRNVIKSSKDKIVRKLNDMSCVFKEMEYTFKRCIKRTLPMVEKKSIIKEDLVRAVCSDCPNRDKCLKLNGQYSDQVFDCMIDAGIETGLVEEANVNNYLISRCAKLPYLISTANEIIRGYREYNIMTQNMDCSKILVAEQFAGVSSVIKNIAIDVDEDVNFDLDLERRISEDLLYNNVFAEEVVVYDKNLAEKSVTILAQNDKINRKAIEKVVSKACNTRLDIVSVVPSKIPNLSTISMSTCPNYDVVFGSATCNKAGTIVSGDTHSFVKIDSGKYLLALSDGMGSGTEARETSDLAISLVENYYKAGFDNNLILSSVNKLLSLNSEESFSALDLCILDFFAGTMDFVKLATPRSYIKKKTGLEVIDASGLPMGILDEMRPHITKKYIESFDIVVLVSDGVADIFGQERLYNFVNNLNMINPQDIADAILSKAKNLSNGVCEDDMTVLTARIFPTNANSK